MTVPDGAAFALSNGAIVHNCSHRADAFRYLAMAYREIVPPPPKPEERFIAVGSGNTATLNDLWDAQKKHRKRI